MRYGFLDEAGDVGHAGGSSEKFIVAVIVVGHPERLRKAVTRTRKTLVQQLRNLPELKATRNSSQINKKLLTRAVEIGFDAVAAVTNKKSLPPLQNPEDIYFNACVCAIREALKRFGPLTVTLDKREKMQRRRDRLDRMVYASLEELDIPLSLRHVESHKERVLQVADAVVWALFQKYERGDETFWQIIRENVVEVKYMERA